jgi:aminoglycoside phosphotransferase (APT) family kinase protein
VPDKPAAEIAIDETLVRRLITAQARAIPDVDDLRLEYVEDGWDSSVWRLGDDYAVRLPRRAVAAPLVESEHRYLPAIAERLAPSGVGVPAPIVRGGPTADYPWRWSIVPWFDGGSAMRVPRPLRSTWAEPLAAALVAMHVPAVGAFPANPFRGIPLARRADGVAQRFAALRAADAEDRDDVDALQAVWESGLAAAPWSHGPLWIHGDLHPGNVIVRDRELVALIDFGDLTAGDPAYDLGFGWLAFDPDGREAFRAATDHRYDEATWARAHGWAAAEVLMFLSHTDDDPEYLAFGREALAALVG